MVVDKTPEPAILEGLGNVMKKMPATYTLIKERAFEQDNYELLSLMKNLEDTSFISQLHSSPSASH